ncbi:MAG TPA: hypothetical protein VHB30_10125, partial [Solirubrobacteraceae bacterium]|nr:hypothetical protein [Solirubrobacteraceae bacterium]
MLRPESLLAARERYEAGDLPAEDLRRLEDDAIRDVIALQQDVGLQAVTDGELRRGSWHMDFIYEIGGVERATEAMPSTFNNEGGTILFTPTKPVVTRKLSFDHTIFADAFAFLKDNVTKGTPKLTIPSPSMVHYRGGRAAIDQDAYPDMAEFWSDLAKVYQQEIRALADLGCTYLQLDDTSLAYLNDPDQRAAFDERGEDGEHQHLTYIRTFNAALEGRPEGMTIATHMCRGNFRSSWVAQGGYDFVAEPLFN